MKNKIEILEEKINYLRNAIGEIDTTEFVKTSGSKKTELKNVTEVILHLQNVIKENDSIQLKDIFKKCNVLYNLVEELSPFLDFEKLKNDQNMTEKEMHLLILTNYDELLHFSKNLKIVKENQKYLEFNPVIDGQDKIKKIKPLELKTLNMESNISQISSNVDSVIQNYHQTVFLLFT